MTFDCITEDKNLWAVRYDGEDDNVLFRLFDQWDDAEWLRSFFTCHFSDLVGYFKITNINQAVLDTMDDHDELECLLLDLDGDVDLDALFKPLENYRTSEMLLGKEKARPHRRSRHPSWLRIYAIKLDKGMYLVTGGAIKLTFRMDEREHTRRELYNLEKVRNFLLEHQIIDSDSFLEENI